MNAPAEGTASSKSTARVVPVRHGIFSPARIRAIAGITLTELVRLKVFYFMAVFGLLLLGGALLSVNFSFEEEFQMLKDVGLGAMSIFASLLAVVATAMLIPKDIEDRTLYTILAKPVHRYEYLAGKLLGVFVLLAISLALMAALFTAMLEYRENVRLAQTALEYAAAPEGEPEAAQSRIRASASAAALLPAYAAILLRSAIVASFTLLIATFARSAVFTIIVAFMVYLIGHLQGVAREYWIGPAGAARDFFSGAFLAVVALIFPDLQMFNVVDEIVAGVALPVGLMIRLGLLGLFYCVVYYIVSWLIFVWREL